MPQSPSLGNCSAALKTDLIRGVKFAIEISRLLPESWLHMLLDGHISTILLSSQVPSKTLIPTLSPFLFPLPPPRTSTCAREEEHDTETSILHPGAVDSGSGLPVTFWFANPCSRLLARCGGGTAYDRARLLAGDRADGCVWADGRAVFFLGCSAGTGGDGREGKGREVTRVGY